MDEPAHAEAPRAARSLVVDGPPLWTVAIVFTGLLAVSWGESDPAAGLAVMAVGTLVALAANVDFANRRRRLEPGAPLLAGTPRPPPPVRPLRVP